MNESASAALVCKYASSYRSRLIHVIERTKLFSGPHGLFDFEGRAKRNQLTTTDVLDVLESRQCLDPHRSSYVDLAALVSFLNMCSCAVPIRCTSLDVPYSSLGLSPFNFEGRVIQGHLMITGDPDVLVDRHCLEVHRWLPLVAWTDDAAKSLFTSELSFISVLLFHPSAKLIDCNCGQELDREHDIAVSLSLKLPHRW